ncbi:hypothetical protein [Serratia ficaria]|uniref:hypothetical protein n=1 Tax=Serratia ficaria TaxID=61651 RepID=UPI0021CA5359|nr:hypothetical protein [Serratia ficaria]
MFRSLPCLSNCLKFITGVNIISGCISISVRYYLSEVLALLSDDTITAPTPIGIKKTNKLNDKDVNNALGFPNPFFLERLETFLKVSTARMIQIMKTTSPAIKSSQSIRIERDQNIM